MFAALSYVAKHGLKSLVDMDMLLEQKKKHESQNPLGSFRNRVTVVGVARHGDKQCVCEVIKSNIDLILRL